MPTVQAKERAVGSGRTSGVHPNGKRVFRLDAGERPGAARRRAAGGRLPSWRELKSAVNAERVEQVKNPTFVESVSTRRFVLLILVIVAAFTIYIAHVQATQSLLGEVQEARRENLRLHLKYNRLKGQFDYATSPEVIYERAKTLGLEEGYRYRATIVIE